MACGLQLRNQSLGRKGMNSDSDPYDLGQRLGGPKKQQSLSLVALL